MDVLSLFASDSLPSMLLLIDAGTEVVSMSSGTGAIAGVSGVGSKGFPLASKHAAPASGTNTSSGSASASEVKGA